jgi:hypothetical protein
MLVDAAIRADAAKRQTTAKLFFGDRPVGSPPGHWSQPTKGDRERARSQSRAAARAARDQLQKLGITSLYTTLRELPRVRIAWDAPRPEEALEPAPLIHSLVDGDALRLAAIRTANTFSHYTAPVFDAEVRRELMLQLNAFAQLEINLWQLAADGGHLHPPPYAVRYDLVRWFWHPSVSGGAILCLRCGDELRYARRGRTLPSGNDGAREAIRTGRCRDCSRGREDDWPGHAVEPYRRGIWLLRCNTPSCEELFIGRRQAQHCEHHRLNRLSPCARGSQRASAQTNCRVRCTLSAPSRSIS